MSAFTLLIKCVATLGANAVEEYEVKANDKIAITRWTVIREIRNCELCGASLLVETTKREGREFRFPCEVWLKCEMCIERLDKIRKRRGRVACEIAKRAGERSNKEELQRQANLRWARAYASHGGFTGKEFKELCETYGNICLCCRRRRERLVADHIVPLKRGGSNNIVNIQPLCEKCNSAKGIRIRDYRKRFRHKLV